ncbi:MAG: hypothetical protein WCQ23_03815 [Candidatus Methanomethylophilaceae archaeon]
MVKADKKLIFVVTNDSTVFLKDGIASAFEMFGGRMTEVKELVARLDTASKNDKKMCDVSFGVISSHFGFVPGNYTVAPYDHVMSCKADYEAVQAKKDYLGKLEYVAKPFDKVVVCVPKDMFAMMLENDTFQDGKVIAVTSPDFKKDCEDRGWTFLERKGARVGKENAEEIFKMIEEIC